MVYYDTMVPWSCGIKVPSALPKPSCVAIDLAAGNKAPGMGPQFWGPIIPFNCKDQACVPMLYYTGHGAAGSGNWCFKDGCLNFADIWELLPVGVSCPWIFADCCYSGHWANQARVKPVP